MSFLWHFFWIKRFHWSKIVSNIQEIPIQSDLKIIRDGKLLKSPKYYIFSQKYYIFIILFRNETTMVDIVAITVGTRCGTSNTLQSYWWYQRRFIYWKYRHGYIWFYYQKCSFSVQKLANFNQIALFSTKIENFSIGTNHFRAFLIENNQILTR